MRRMARQEDQGTDPGPPRRGAAAEDDVLEEDAGELEEGGGGTCAATGRGAYLHFPGSLVCSLVGPPWRHFGQDHKADDVNEEES